jgi:hypothetical protein
MRSKIGVGVTRQIFSCRQRSATTGVLGLGAGGGQRQASEASPAGGRGGLHGRVCRRRVLHPSRQGLLNQRKQRLERAVKKRRGDSYR